MRRGEPIVRKKLYKSGKNFVVASLVSVMGLVIASAPARADDVSSNQVPIQNTSGLTDSTQTPASDTQTADPTDQDSQKTDSTQNDSVDNQNTLTAKGTQTADPAASQNTQQTDSTQNSPVDNQNAPAAKDQQNNLQDQTPVQAKDQQGKSSTNTVQSPAVSDQQVHSLDQAPQQPAAAPTDASDPVSQHIKVIDGKSYYVGDDGQIKKNFTVVDQDKILYFDKDTGALQSSSDYHFQQGLASENNSFTAHNAVAGNSGSYFTNVDGYLTADSWYQPKDILSQGQTWTTASSADMRPLLMTWWPDKETQVNYLNFMKNLGLSDSQSNFSGQDDQNSLNTAAQDVQVNIEKRISQEQGQTQWLKDAISQFVKTQPNWNISSESQDTGPDKDHLQGGALLYVNDPKTPDADSDYRLLNRTPTNQTGTPAYFTDPTQGGFDFLLANDVDNSNPVVQAEQLNWMYYLLNFGSITNNDPEANFDSIRVDAVDNVDADLLQVAGDYFRAAYGVDQNDAQSDKHVSILEDWSDNDAEYVKDHGSDQLSMDNKLRLSLKYSLTMPYIDENGNQRSGLEPLISNSLVNRANDTAASGAQPNYSFIRAHDSEVQTVIAEIIKDKIDPDSDGLTPTLDQLNQAFKIYDADQLKTDKEFTQFNIPSAYALLLSNKDTVPRVYYGDLYTDDGDYMANKSPYFDAIDNLLKSRIRFAAGGQQMSIQYMQGDNSMPSDSYRSVLTSVRYGKNAMTANDRGSSETRREGLAVIESNNPNLKLNSQDRVVINMGNAHRNEAYRPILLTTANGLESYTSDQAAAGHIIYTNSLGQLIFDGSQIFGAANPQVSGYLAVWAPVGAAAGQDVRTQASTTATTDGMALHSNAALDSQVIYESFSNFQSMPQNTADFANVKIAQNTDLFNSWGITNFEFPPQYRSSQDGSFLDSIVQNGYAFTDRYDLGFNTPTKYGTVEQLRDAVKALHRAGIQSMADWVPDQIYNLTGLQIVAATRVNNSGIYDQNSIIDDSLYAAKIKGGGTYQAMYGGAFLDQIKALYPQLFQVKQISSGQPMDPSQRITEWSAKYFNGSNIQGQGAYYVLKDWGSNQYFTVIADHNLTAFLPKQLEDEASNTGFVNDGTGMTYYSTSGYQAKNTFIADENNNWYYFGPDGYMKVGFQKVAGHNYYFLPNGIELQEAFLQDAQGRTYYFNQLGQQQIGGYFMDTDKNWRYFDQNGVMAQGLTTIAGADGVKHIQFFDDNGLQVKGKAAKNSDGKLYYFDGASGDMITDRFEKLDDGSWAYFGDDGAALVGLHQVAGQTLFFDQDGHQVKGQTAIDDQGKLRYFDAESGNMLRSQFKELSDGSWAYFGADGAAVTGAQNINGQNLYFDANGHQVKGQSVADANGVYHYYDANSGEMIVNRFERTGDNTWKYFNADGSAVTGSQNINGQHLFFESDGQQVKGHEAIDDRGLLHFYDADSGEMVINRFERLSDNAWAYFDADGNAVTGSQVINGQHLFFRADGQQVKGQYAQDENGVVHFYDAASGEMVP